jgi:hypothetical protein
MKQVCYYKFALEYIEQIQKWFEKLFFFKPSARNVVEYCVLSITETNREFVKHIRSKSFLYDDIKKVFISDTAYKRLNVLAKKYENIFDLGKPLLVSTLIATRAFYLPSIEKAKSPNKLQGFGRKNPGGYKPVLNLENKFFFYDESSNPILIGKD